MGKKRMEMATVGWVSVDQHKFVDDAVRVSIGFNTVDDDERHYLNLTLGGDSSEGQEKFASMQLAALLKGREPVEIELSESEYSEDRMDVFVPRIDEDEVRPAKKSKKKAKPEPEEDEDSDEDSDEEPAPKKKPPKRQTPKEKAKKSKKDEDDEDYPF